MNLKRNKKLENQKNEINLKNKQQLVFKPF